MILKNCENCDELFESSDLDINGNCEDCVFEIEEEIYDREIIRKGEEELEDYD